MKGSLTLGKYLFTRLRNLGVTDIHGIPGDYTLKALDHLQASGSKWIGGCNELNAGYAADGYARVKGLGALFTTYGVGELSAINAVAGSYAEHVPVIHIVGSPARRVQRSRAAVHHSLGDGRSRVFAEIYEKVTAAQAYLWDPNTAPEMIDETIKQCLTKSLPVYIEVPCDMIPLEVSTERLADPITSEVNVDSREEDEFVDLVLRRIYAAKQPLLLVDRGEGMPQVKTEINKLVEKSGIPTLTMPSGGGMVDHSLKNYFGVHAGPVGQIDTMPFMEASDLVLAFGPLFSDTQTLGWSVVPDAEKTITITNQSIRMPSSHAINAKSFMEKLNERLDIGRISRSDVTSLGDFRAIKAPPADPSGPIDQDGLYLRLNSYLQPDDIILLGNATPIIGGRDFVLPPRAQIIASGMWFSIGHMLPAAQGVAVAQKGKGRTILFDGDGSFQITVQELSTVIRQRLDMTIFIINNNGYAYERQIHGMNEDYNDLAPWRYLDAPRFFGAPDDYPVETHRIEKWEDLDRLLATESFHDGKGLKLVEVIVGKYDVPEKFKPVFKNAGEML